MTTQRALEIGLKELMRIYPEIPGKNLFIEDTLIPFIGQVEKEAEERGIRRCIARVSSFANTFDVLKDRPENQGSPLGIEITEIISNLLKGDVLRILKELLPSPPKE